MNKPETDNIELGTFLHFLQEFKSFIQSTFSYFWRHIKRRFILLLLPVIVCGGLGFLAYQQEEPIYTVEMQLGFNELHKKTYGEMILRLQEQLDDDDHVLVAAALDMPVEDVKQIVSIKALNIARSPLEEDITFEHAPFYIVAELLDKSIADTLQVHVITYLRNNPMNVERRRVNQENMKARYAYLEQQVAWMDSIKLNYNERLRKGQVNEFMAGEVAIEKLFLLSDSFFFEKLKVKSGIESYKAVELIYGFVPSEKPEKAAIVPFMARYLLIGLAISVVLLLWIAIPSSPSRKA